MFGAQPLRQVVVSDEQKFPPAVVVEIDGVVVVTVVSVVSVVGAAVVVVLNEVSVVGVTFEVAVVVRSEELVLEDDVTVPRRSATRKL